MGESLAGAFLEVREELPSLQDVHCLDASQGVRFAEANDARASRVPPAAALSETTRCLAAVPSTAALGDAAFFMVLLHALKRTLGQRLRSMHRS